MGPYCKFCDQRCFVPHPENTPKYVYAAYRTNTIIATCPDGQAFEMERLGYCYDRILKEIAICAEHKCAVCKESLDTPEQPIAEDDGHGQTVYSHPRCRFRKQPIAFIGIERETTASVKHGIERRVNIRIYRTDENGQFDKAGNYYTNPLLASHGKISAASVARAERAQMVLTRPVIDTTLVEDEDDEDENPYLLTGPELSRAVAARLQGYNP